MKLTDILQGLETTLLTSAEIAPDFEVSGCYCGDLLSNVMAYAKAGDIWLTIQTHQNIIAVAVLLNLHCIILAEGNLPQADTLLKAEAEGVTILSSPETTYQIAGRLYLMGLGR